jgi:hypothetical protein
MKVFGFSPLVLGEQPDCPSLCTLRGYFQIKLPQRAGRIVWLLLPFPLLPSSLIYLFGGGLVDLIVRASDEHILIVRVPRAGGRPGLPLPCLSWLAYFPSREGGLLGLPLRASIEGLLRPCREHRRSTGHPPSPFLRGHPRISCRLKSPRIERTSPPLSEPLNFPQLATALPPAQYRHPGCSSI